MPNTINLENNWRWCQRCGGLWLANAAAGEGLHNICPAGGTHSAPLPNDYGLLNNPNNNFTGMAMQSVSVCALCGCLFSTSGNVKNFCAANGPGGRHASGDTLLKGQTSGSAMPFWSA